MKNLLERSLFVLTVSAMVLSFFVHHAVINTIFVLSGLIYISLGWYLLNPLKGKKFDPVYFLEGYFFSTAMVGFLFTAKDYPLDTLFIQVAAAGLFVGLLLLLILHKNRKYWFEPEIKCAVFLILTALMIFY